MADQLADCKPGDEYTLTFVVDTKTGTGLTGSASEIEHIGGGDYEGEGGEPEMSHGRTAKDNRVPKAILLVSK